MRAAGVPLFSVEQHLPAAAFDVLAFNLSAELVYTNVVNLIDLAGLPLHAADRGGDDALVVAGGHCAFNPEPLADFVDAFVLGDGEEVVGEVNEVMAAWLASRAPDGARPRRAAARAGRGRGCVRAGALRRRVRRRAAGGDRAASTTRAGRGDQAHGERPGRLALPARARSCPLTEVVHDRLNVEVFRGCTRGCRFCQAGMITRPVRERPAAQVREMVRRGLEWSGHDEVALTSLSSRRLLGHRGHGARHRRRPDARRPGLGQPALAARRRLHGGHGGGDPEGAPHRAHVRARGRHVADAHGDQQADHRGGPLRRGRRRLQPGLAPGQALLPHRAADRARRGRARDRRARAPAASRSAGATTSR